MSAGRLGFDMLSKMGTFSMVMAKRSLAFPHGVPSWLGVSRDHLVHVTKSHGHRTCLGLGLLEELKMATQGLIKEVMAKLPKWVWFQQVKCWRWKVIHLQILWGFMVGHSLTRTSGDQKWHFGK